MSGLGWGFQFASHIKISIGKIERKLVEKTKKTGKFT